jgi:hypothetical protein
MVGVYGLAHPAHCVGSAQAVEDVIVVQDHLHHDILVHARSGTRVAVDRTLVAISQ